jgi:hypothetical protein
MSGDRIEREKTIISAMIALNCRLHHNTEVVLCEECKRLEEYAHKRLLKCTFGNRKPACKQCPVHCYAKAEREQMRELMKKTGPKMLFHHPVYALEHLWDNTRSRFSDSKAKIPQPKR